MKKRNKLSQGWPHSTGLKRCKTTGVKDCISALPNDLLLDVLTRLTVKEAATTSTLSKRWRYLWRSHPTLDLRCLPRAMDPATFKQTVNSILGQYNSPKLHELRIAGSVPGNSNSSINDWLSFAIDKGASKLQLCLSLFPSPDHVILYRVPVHPFGAKRVESLRHLSLTSVNLCSEVFDIMLTSCCNLEYFSLMFNNELLSAKNTTPHQNLKAVKFYLCKGLEMVELWAPNLSSFDYHQGTRAICIKDCKQLLSLRLTTGTAHRSMLCPKAFVSQFSSYLPQLESLIIAVHLFKNESDFAELCLLSNLKRLALDVKTNSGVPLVYKLAEFVLKTAPYLQLLEINLPAGMTTHLNWIECQYKLPSMSLQNLVELKLTGFRGDAYTRLFLSYILEYAPSLQKIDVTRLSLCRAGDHEFLSSSPLREDEARIYKEMGLELMQRMPINARLFFHDE